MGKTALLLLILLFSPVSLSQIIDDPNGNPGGFSTALTREQENSIEQRIAQVEDSTGIEIGVAIIDTTEGKPIGQLAFEIGNEYGIGKKEVFNGVLILIAVDDREWFIATAKGIEGTIPDILAK